MTREAMTPDDVQAIRDSEHLNILSIANIVLACIWGFAVIFPGIYALMGLVGMAVGAGLGGGEGTGIMVVSGMFSLVFGIFAIVGAAVVTVVAMSAHRLHHRRHYDFCFFVAILQCIMVPLGTVVGVFTLIVLNRPTVKAIFH